jgi:DNA-binding transcriptional ArsR family regulator
MRQKSDGASSPRRPQVREPLPEEVVELTAERLRVVAKAKRIALLEALRDGEATVQELADRVGLAHQNASHHLALLWQAGILSRRHEATTTLYAIDDWSAWWVVEQVAGWLQQSCLEQQDGQASAK